MRNLGWLDQGLKLSGYDLACGREIDAAFATFQGMDPQERMRIVFAALVHCWTGGHDDGSNNPLALTGAGWVGAIECRASVTGPPSGVTAFATITDGCRAAAVACQFPEYRGVQVAYRSGDPRRLAAALQASPLRTGAQLSGLASDVERLVRHRHGIGAFIRMLRRPWDGAQIVRP